MEPQQLEHVAIALGKVVTIRLQAGGEEGNPLQKTVRSTYEHLVSAVEGEVREENTQPFLRAVVRGLIESRAPLDDMGKVLPHISDLPSNPRFEVAGRFSQEEVMAGAVFIDRRNNAYRATNAAAKTFFQTLIAAFRERGRQKRPEGA